MTTKIVSITNYWYCYFSSQLQLCVCVVQKCTCGSVWTVTALWRASRSCSSTSAVDSRVRPALCSAVWSALSTSPQRQTSSSTSCPNTCSSCKRKHRHRPPVLIRWRHKPPTIMTEMKNLTLNVICSAIKV